MSIQIDYDIPIPRFKPTGGNKYHFSEIGTGGSTFFEREKDESPKEHANRVRNAAQKHARKYGGRFVVRAMSNGARVWRVE